MRPWANAIAKIAVAVSTVSAVADDIIVPSATLPPNVDAALSDDKSTAYLPSATANRPTGAPRSLPNSFVGNRRVETAPTKPESLPRLNVVDAADKPPAKTLKSRLTAAVNRVSGPISRWLHGESPLADERGKPALAPAGTAQAKRFSPEIESIHYLANLDSNAYPEIVDSLIASLDDRSPAVRIAVLESLLTKSRERRHFCGRETKSATTSPDCPACRTTRKIVTRLDALLLDIDERGRLKERNAGVRDLAVAVILALDVAGPSGRGSFEFVAEETPMPAVETAPEPIQRPTPTQSTSEPKPTRSKSKLFRWFETAPKSGDEATSTGSAN